VIGVAGNRRGLVPILPSYSTCAVLIVIPRAFLPAHCRSGHGLWLRRRTLRQHQRQGRGERRLA
jgi:hypothetical protein